MRAWGPDQGGAEEGGAEEGVFYTVRLLRGTHTIRLPCGIHNLVLPHITLIPSPHISVLPLITLSSLT